MRLMRLNPGCPFTLHTEADMKCCYVYGRRLIFHDVSVISLFKKKTSQLQQK